MTPTRRKYLTSTSALGLASLSGCLSAVIADESDESDSQNDEQGSDQPANNTSQTDDTTEEEQDSEDETEDEEDSSTNATLVSRVESLREYLDWMSTEYDGREASYIRASRSVHEQLKRLYESNPQNVPLEDVDTVITALEDMEDRVESLFGEYYSTHYPFGTITYHLEDSVRPSLRRKEYDKAWNDLRPLVRAASQATSTEALRRYYPRYVVHRNPYTLFTLDNKMDSIRTNRIVEVSYSTASYETGLFATPGDMNIAQHPLGVKQPTDQFETIASHPDRETDIFTLSQWLSDRRSNSELFINIIDYSLSTGGYPESYVLSADGSDSDETDASDLRKPNFNEAESVPVYIQTFDTAEIAQRVADNIMSRGTLDMKATYYGTEYSQLFYSSPELNETVYADVAQMGRHVVAVDLSRTQWPDRFDESDFDTNQARVKQILEGTIFDNNSS